jgi:DNA (cytosine-5)-methyltransferase 1
MSLKINWFIKGRRAKSVDDYETWNEGGVVPTLNLGDNTGDTRATVLIFYGNRVDDIRIQRDVINTLQARMGTGGGNMPIVAYPIQDGREMDKSQNGLGVGGENDPAYTLDRTGGQAVAIQGNMIGRADTAGPQGKGYTEEGEPMFTLTKTDVHAVAGSTVRRLTPMECERLQGFPDSWTKFDAEGNEVTDGHRYKQMGNAVAVPVVSWLVNRLMEVNK